MAVFPAVVHVRVLDVAAATAFGVDAGVVGALDGDVAIAVEAVMDVHSTAGVVDVGARTIGTCADDAAVGCMNLVAAGGGAAHWSTGVRNGGG